MVQVLPFELMELPDEILLMVMGFLDCDSLLDAVYVNKHFRELAEPFIYKSIGVLHGEKALNLSHSLVKDKRRPGWVRSLLISTKFGQEHALMKLPPAIYHMSNLEELRLETPDCNRKKPDDRKVWIDLQDRYEHIFRLSSVLVTDRRDRLLPNLKSCVLHFVDTHTELYSLSRYSSIFLHPTLEFLTISCMSTDYPEALFQDIPDVHNFYQSTNLQTLHLEECDIHPPSLKLLLSFPKGLRSLKISEGTRYDGIFRAGSSRMHGNVKPFPLAQVLVDTCKNTLESLSLALGYVRSHGNEINHAGQYLKLNELDKLKHIEVSNRTLNLLRSRPECDHFTWKRLPACLETFGVFAIPLLPTQQSVRQTYIPLESCIVKHKQLHGLPNLRKIIYSYEYNESTDDDDVNFNDLLMTLVYNRANDNPPDAVATQNQNPILTVLQHAVGAAINHQPQVPVNNTFVTAAMNPNLDAPPQNIQPPRFRWRTGPYGNRQHSHPELSRSDSAKLRLLSTIHDSILSDLTKAGTQLQIDLITLPRGFIPPYLFPEDKPSIHEAWFSSAKPLTPHKFLDSIRRQREAARRHVSRSARANGYASDNEEDQMYEHLQARSNIGPAHLQQDTAWTASTAELEAAARAEQSTSEDESDDSSITDEMEVADVLEILAQEARMQADSEDEVDAEAEESDTSSGTDSSGGSIYVDAGTDVEMSELEPDTEFEDEHGILFFST